VAVVGGVEASAEEDDRTVNEAVIFFPDRVRVFQRKQKPSVFELKTSLFASDGLFQLMRDTPLGTLAVVVCSDYLEADIVSQLCVDAVTAVDTLIVCSRNPRPELFETLALADAARLYAQVLIVNTLPLWSKEGPASGGGFLALPRSRDPESEPEHVSLASRIPGAAPPELLVWTLDQKGLRARDHRRGAKGWLPPSHFVTGGGER
jgi:hypothetical protein